MDHDAVCRVLCQLSGAEAALDGARARAMTIYRSAAFMRVLARLRSNVEAEGYLDDLVGDLGEYCHSLGCEPSRLDEIVREAMTAAAEHVKRSQP